MLQKLPVYEEHTVDCNVSSLHQSHGEPKERFGQMNQVVDLPPFDISNLELRVFMITAVSVDDIPEPARTAKHQKRRIPACLNIM
ncbi:hypothetical protein LT330_008158 [Penicillium expansum]|nr:hypothetical protein LT330_008158 [Penicillium expansum]